LIIETERLLLRPFVAADWPQVHRYASLPDFSRFDAWGPNSIEDTQRFIALCMASLSEEPILGYHLAVVLKQIDRLIGGCTLGRNGAEAREAFLGYAIDPEFQRQGYATEAAAALIGFGFRQLALSRIYAKCNALNVASRRVLEKLGMQLVALRRQHREIKGVMIDSCEYELRTMPDAHSEVAAGN
jgi:ribosomal-protein-alanine N-acetyltransferase